jgi:hypothetical protein
LLKDAGLLPEDGVLGSQLSSAPNRRPERNEDQLYPTRAPPPRSQTSYLYMYAQRAASVAEVQQRSIGHDLGTPETAVLRPG